MQQTALELSSVKGSRGDTVGDREVRRLVLSPVVSANMSCCSAVANMLPVMLAGLEL
jgi:hypothetical protein